MQKYILTALGFFLFVCTNAQKSVSRKSDSAFKQSGAIEKNAIGKPFPSFSLENADQAWTNEKLLGKTVYINFWFAACAPCMAEMLQVNDLYQKFKTDTNFIMLSLTFDNLEKINAVRSAHSMDYPIFSVSVKECMRLNPAHSFPASIVLNKDGLVTYYDSGGMGIGLLNSRYFKRKIYPTIAASLSGQ